MTERIAPVQGYAAGIPWSMHLRAYDAYCKKYGPQAAMIDLEGRNCRGGFSTGELDDFIPGWREELSELRRLAASVERLRAALKKLPTTIRAASGGAGRVRPWSKMAKERTNMSEQPQQPEERLSPEQRKKMRSLFGRAWSEEPAVLSSGDGTIKFKRSATRRGWPDPVIQDTKDLSDAELANYIEVCSSDYDGIGASLRDAIVRVLRR